MHHKDKKPRVSPLQSYRAASARAHNIARPGREARYFSKNIEIGQIIVARTTLGQTAMPRPLYVWGLYYNEDMNIIGVDAFLSAILKPEKKTYSSDLAIKSKELRAGTYLRSDTHIHSPETVILLQTNALTGVHGHYTDFFVENDKINARYFPDIILRRIEAICFSPDVMFTTVSNGVDVPYFSSAMRRGFLFKSIPKSETRASGAFAPDVKGTMELQGPYTIPGFLEQKDVDRIAAIAKNYAGYCFANKLPAIWPEYGHYPRWPDEFMAFEQIREHAAIKKPSWFGGAAGKVGQISCPMAVNGPMIHPTIAV